MSNDQYVYNYDKQKLQKQYIVYSFLSVWDNFKLL